MTNNHQCIAGSYCRGGGLDDDGVRQPALTEKPDSMCDSCLGSNQTTIQRLAIDYDYLRATLGERRAQEKAPVSSSPTPRIPIDANSERFITELVEWAGFAADLIATSLNIPRPDGGRALRDHIDLDGQRYELEEGSVANLTWENTQPPEADRLTAYLSTVANNVETLALAPKQEVQVWAQPKRCDEHAEDIARAKRILVLARNIRNATEIADSKETLAKAFAAAGNCNECCGWSEDGRKQARQVIEISGLDVLRRLARLHALIRQHLGQTKLRHRYAMPCPRCGAPVGRDDGTTIVTCENNSCIKTNGRYGPSSWTEREYDFLSGMLVDDVTSKYLLAEAYVRLDAVQQLVTDLATDEKVKDSEAVQLILGALKPLIADHATAADRAIATDKASAKQRQGAYDDSAWKRQPAYKKPPRKPRPAAEVPAGKRIAASSLTLVSDIAIDIDTKVSLENVCKDCHLIPCDCEKEAANA